jgi:hypothetical protein
LTRSWLSIGTTRRLPCRLSPVKTAAAIAVM